MIVLILSILFIAGVAFMILRDLIENIRLKKQLEEGEER